MLPTLSDASISKTPQARYTEALVSALSTTVPQP